MYDWPEIRAATDQFWSGLAHYAGEEGMLDRRGAHDTLWSNEMLMFSQTCGYPLTHEFAGQFRYVATPHYSADGCNGADYCSIIFAKQPFEISKLGRAKPAVNSIDSMSGMLALKLAFANLPDALDGPLLTGSHAASLAAVQKGEAYACAVDAVVVALARRHRPHLLKGLFEIARSPSVPGLPYVTRTGDVAVWRDALHKTFNDPQLATARDALLLNGFSVLPANAYEIILHLESAL